MYLQLEIYAHSTQSPHFKDCNKTLKNSQSFTLHLLDPGDIYFTLTLVTTGSASGLLDFRPVPFFFLNFFFFSPCLEVFQLYFIILLLKVNAIPVTSPNQIILKYTVLYFRKSNECLPIPTQLVQPLNPDSEVLSS